MMQAEPEAEPAEPAAQGHARVQAGFRLERLEVFNWGTFDGRVWGLDIAGKNALLTGDIGSGKSTLVDAITTLLVAPQKVTYNKAAGAEARERTLRSYMLGYFKSERADSSDAARPIGLRDHNAYSVILSRFVNLGFGQVVTLAQVFWARDLAGQPARMFVVADASLSIKEHFADFGSDITDLRKRLRRAGFEVSDSYPPYCSAFRRRLGIDNEQALDLFNQTVSLKSVGNLTDFVRQHMLQPFAVEPRIQALLGHFDDLNRAHEAVLKARAQIERLTPLVEECRRHASLSAEAAALRACREALRAWFACKKASLLEHRIEALNADLERLAEQIRALDDKRAGHVASRDELKQAIAENGGDRIERLKADIAGKQTELNARRKRAAQYDGLARAVGLSAAVDANAFLENRTAVNQAIKATSDRQATVQNDVTDAEVEFRALRDQHDDVRAELDSLRQRRSNIPARMLSLRAALCDALDLEADALPFAGELLQVRDDERDWEGAIERLLHNFGLSLLVADADYASVAQWVDRTHLGDRLVYYRVRPHSVSQSSPEPISLVRKLAVKPDSAFYGWLEAEMARRFDYACCDTLDQFRREKLAITRAGQIKGTGERHEKDDRHRLDDRARYVLGWSNEAKIAAYEKQSRDLEQRMQVVASRIAILDAERASLAETLGHLQQLAVFENFRDLDWRPLCTEIEDLERERQKLEEGSDILRSLQERLKEVEQALQTTSAAIEAARGREGSTTERRDSARVLFAECKSVLESAPEELQAGYFPRVEALAAEVLGAQALSVESCDRREKDVRDTVQKKIDAEDHKINRSTEKIVSAMQAYAKDYPLDTREVDASVGAAGEYAGMLERLQADDLPRFEGRFKELLNENTIREVASFQSELSRERQDIKDRIAVINASLRDIDYNPGRYILLEAAPTTDADIRDFQQDLRACTEGTLTGSEDEAYSEAKFVQVKRIIERFHGREGSAEADERWTRKVTDVRSWFAFSASERWREDDREHEHYSDSGGKSGGQKEKLAYTVLAASLAYQFGLEWAGSRSRSFRFVVIDEAFGRGSDESTRYGLELFAKLGLQLLIVTPLQKIHVIEPYVAAVGFVHNEEGRRSMLRNLTIAEYRAERTERAERTARAEPADRTARSA